MFDIHWTDGSEAHIARHGVTPEEVEQSTQRPFYTMPGRDATTLLFGQTDGGRYLLVRVCKKKAR